MGLLDLLNHLLNFVAPAGVVGVLLALIAPLVYRKVALAHRLSTQIAINFIVGLAALAGGMVFFGHDGKMATYAAMVVACAASQWWGMRR